MPFDFLKLDLSHTTWWYPVLSSFLQIPNFIFFMAEYYSYIYMYEYIYTYIHTYHIQIYIYVYYIYTYIYDFLHCLLDTLTDSTLWTKLKDWCVSISLLYWYTFT
jgi:hypothetical protein